MNTSDFDADYDVEASGDGRVARVETFGEKLGIPLRELTVRPHGAEPWRGRFKVGTGNLDGVFATPSPDTVCIVLGGIGYWIPVLDPTRYVMVPMGVSEVVPVRDAGVLVLASRCNLFGYGPQGLAWSAKNIVEDDLRISEVSGVKIIGHGWEPVDLEMRFSVDAKTGRVEEIDPVLPRR